MATAAAAATVSEQLPHSASSCSSFRIPRCFRQAGCRGPRPDFLFLSSLYSQSDQRNCLVCVSPAVGAAERFRSAVNASQRSASDLFLSARATSCGPPLYTVAPTFSNVPVLAQCFASVLWPVFSFPAEINSNDFERFGNYLADSNSNFVVVEITSKKQFDFLSVFGVRSHTM